MVPARIQIITRLMEAENIARSAAMTDGCEFMLTLAEFLNEASAGLAAVTLAAMALSEDEAVAS